VETDGLHNGVLKGRMPKRWRVSLLPYYDGKLLGSLDCFGHRVGMEERGPDLGNLREDLAFMRGVALHNIDHLRE
jgi:hypothetical protein